MVERLTQRLTSLQVRLLVVLVVAVAAALGTVALTAQATTAWEFQRYVGRNQAEMQAMAEKIAATTGDRLLVTNGEGRVILDSSGELLGQEMTHEEAHRLAAQPPGAARFALRAAESPAGGAVLEHAEVDVLFVRRMVGPGELAPAEPAADGTWTMAVPPPPGVEAVEPASRVQLSVSDAVVEPLLSKPFIGLPAARLFDREQVFVDAVGRSLWVGVLVGSLVAAVLGLTFARRILHPVQALTVAAGRLERGDLSQRVPVSGRDEIGQLAHAFNAMADGLERTERLRRTMVTDVAHELRTPLTNLRGYLEAVRDGVAEPTPAVVESLYEEALLLNQLVEDLQDLSLSEAGQLSLSRELLDVRGVLQTAAQAMQARFDTADVRLRVDVPREVLPIDADARRLGQVLRNLLANSAAHTPAGGEVVLGASREGCSVLISVRDTGRGIPTEHLPHIFERFYRVDPSRTRATGGAGIGLAVVKQLVEAHGGSVAVESSVGVGSVIRVRLPLALAGQSEVHTPALEAAV